MTPHPAANIWDRSLAALLAQARMPSAAFRDRPCGRLTFLFQEFFFHVFAGAVPCGRAQLRSQPWRPVLPQAWRVLSTVPVQPQCPRSCCSSSEAAFWGDQDALGALWLCTPWSPFSPVDAVHVSGQGTARPSCCAVTGGTAHAFAARVCNPTITDTWQ